MRNLQALVRTRGIPVVTISDLASVYHAALVLKEHGVGALLVVRDRQVAGILTTGDIARRVVAEDCDPMTTRVREIMTENMVYGGIDQDAAEAAALMTASRISHLPVLGRQGHLLGILRRADLVAADRPTGNRMPSFQPQPTTD